MTSATKPAFDLGYSVHPTLVAALWAAFKRTLRTWRYARRIGVDPTQWWGVYEHGTEICLAAVGPLPGAEARARQIIKALDAASVDRSPKGGNGEAGAVEDESAVPKGDAQ